MGNVDEPVTAGPERGTDDHLEVRGVRALVERSVHDVWVDEDRVSRAELS